MKKQIILLTAVLLAITACKKNEAPSGSGEAAQAAATPAPTPAVPVETLMRQSYGFAAQMPADTDSYSGFYQLGKMWDDFKQSKTVAAIMSNPLVKQALEKDVVRQARNEAQTDPEAAKRKAILKDMLGNEAFLALAQGSDVKLRAWTKLSDDINAARLQALLTGGVQGMNDPRILMTAIVPDIKDLDIPPMILGFKLTTQKAALDSELAEAVKDLPAFVESAAFTLDGGWQFKSLAVTFGKALPQEQQDSLKAAIAASLSDAQAADAAFQSLMARRLEIAYGYVGDYFIVSIGPDHSHLKFAGNYADSLLARPEVQKAADYTGKPVVAFSWASQKLMEAGRREFLLMAAYEQIKKQLAQTLSADDVAKLETDIKRIDSEGKGVFDRPVAPLVGVEYRDHGLRGEVYGGVSFTSPGAVMKFSGVPTDETFVWVDQVADPVLREAARVWIEDLASTGYETFQRVALPRLPLAGQMMFAPVQNMWVPRLVEFYKITRDQFSKGLGLENVFTMDLKGELPDVPELPPQLHGGKSLRLAYLNQVQDRNLLGQSWDGYFKLANEIAQMMPQETREHMFPDGLPQPDGKTLDGVSLWYYNLPMQPSDFLPNVALTDKTFVASTSRSYSLELSKAAAAATGEQPGSLDIRVNFKPVFDFAGQWLAIASQNPDLFFGGIEEQEAEFKKSEPDIASLLQVLRAFGGMSIRAYQENGMQRISSQIRWNGE